MDMDEIAALVRKERKRRGWSQPQLSEMTEGQVKVGAISLFERRKSDLQPANLRAVLDALDLHEVAGDAQASETRSEWPPDIRWFLDLVGMFLDAMPEERRGAVIKDATRRIVSPQ